MVKLTRNSVFKAEGAKPETTMDKTTRVVKKIVDDEAAKRQVKVDRLRNARLEREAHTPATPAAAPRKKRPAKP